MTKHLPKIAISEQLKESCKLSHARLAAWLEPVGGTWMIQCHSGMAKIRLEWLQTVIQEKGAIVWLAGALSSQRRRYRETGRFSTLAGCKRLFIFPTGTKRHLLIVGADSMDKNNEAFWRVIALQPPEPVGYPTQPQATSISNVPIPDEPANPSEPELTLPDALRQLQALQQNASEFTNLVQTITSIPGENTPISLSESIQVLLQHFVKQARFLLGARYAQLGWFENKPPSEHILHVLVRGQPGYYQTILTDSELDGIKVIPSLGNDFYPIHTYIATLGESLLSNDFPTWAGLVDKQHPTEDSSPISATRNLEAFDIRCHSIIGIPLRLNQEIAGTLLIFDDRLEKSFSQQDLAVLELIAPQIEIAIGYARLNTQLQERITAQNLAESRLVRSARLAAVGEMAAGVAHELNNPLTTVTGFVELVLNELPLDSPLHDDLDLALKEALRARGIVRGLLDFSRPTQDQRVPTDLNDLISQVLNLIRHMLRMNNLTIRLELWDDLPLVIADPNKIQQVLHNLMHNAIQAMPSGGTMTVRTAISQKPHLDQEAGNSHWVSILIQDTGVGIPSESLGRIFEPFYTLQTTDRLEEPGIGLGLAVSYGIIQSHGGSIEVESTIDQGSSFTVYLPLENNG